MSAVVKVAVPEWRAVQLGDVCHKVTTVDPGKKPYEEFTYIDVSSVSNQTFTIETTARIIGRDAPSRARRLVRAGDVIFATVRPTLMRIAQVPTELDGAVCSTGYIVLRAKPELDSRFLFYWLFRPDFVSAMGNLQAGASYPAVNDGQVLAQCIAIPPLDEQKRIVAVLDQAFAALDRARAHAEANLADAESLFDGALRKAFALHLGWPTKVLSEISENLDRQRVPITKHDRQPGGIPYYGASGVVDQVAGHIFDEDLLLVSEDGANLLARTYPIAFSISGKSWVNNHAHVLRFDDVDTQEYVRLYLNSITLAPYVSGMAQPKLNQKALNQIPIPFPDEDRRAAIVAEAALIRGHCNALSRSYDAQLTDLATLRQSLLQRAFSGELA